QHRRTSGAPHRLPSDDRRATAAAIPATRLNPRKRAACLILVTSPLAPTNARFATRKTSERTAGSVEIVSTISSTPTRSFDARRRMAVAVAGIGGISSCAARLGVLIEIDH